MSTPAFSNSISVILPAFNEEECIAEAVQQCLDFLPERFSGHEVIVVDDGSSDDTARIVTEMESSHPTLRLIRLPENQGYGSALATGFRAAESELVFFTDADCQFDIRELAGVIPLLADADVVLGFRVYRYDSVLRCLLSWVYNRLVRVLFLVRVRDVDCSFKLFKREVVENLRLDSTDFFVDTEIVARVAKMKGVRIVEKGVRHYPRKAGRTTVRPSHIPKTLWTVAKMWFRIHFGDSKPRPLDAPQVSGATETVAERSAAERGS